MLNAETLPVIFAGLMGLAILVYALLDGYDLGVGILLPTGRGRRAERDRMIASIGPFWDANETWLVLAVGLLLIAFPVAHSLVLFELYIPAAIMLVGLILRGVAFDFRAKAAVDYQYRWDLLFKAGSIITALMQGYMLGRYVVGFSDSLDAMGFSIASAIGVCCAYCYVGSAWLIMKTEGDLQRRSVKLALKSGRVCMLGIVAVSVLNLQNSADIVSRWFEWPGVVFALMIPAICIAAFFANEWLLRRMPYDGDRYHYLPLLLVGVVFISSFLGLAVSFFPMIIPGKMDIWEAASSPEALSVILIGALIVVPVILVYTVYAYYVFRGKATELVYH